MKQVFIDFPGGAHGNFLEYACNTLLANVPTEGNLFNALGASHDKRYLTDPVFVADHYSYFDQPTPVGAKVISVQIAPDDLLPFKSISLLRAADHNLDNDQLEVDTYNKLNIPIYREMLDDLIANFSIDQVKDSYNAVRDESWPEVNNLDDFENLPADIKRECLEEHGLQLVELSAERPDCPRYILREYFKIEFKDPNKAQVVEGQKTVEYNTLDILYFPFGAFYDLEWFKKELDVICRWTNVGYQDPTDLHTEFMKRQPYYESRLFCDDILKKIVKCEIFDLPKLDLLQESYILAVLEVAYEKEYHRAEWFSDTKQIIDYFEIEPCETN